MYALAERLGKTLGEVMQMTTAEFAGWVAYFNLLAIRQKQGKKP